jgi:hypothetical protein
MEKSDDVLKFEEAVNAVTAKNIQSKKNTLLKTK